MYIYENHMGGLYATENEMPYESRYCDFCGDSDTLLGKAETRKELFWLIARTYYAKEYKREFLNECFPR